MMGAKSVSVSHWSVGDGAREAPMRSMSTPVCPHGPIDVDASVAPAEDTA